MSTIRGYDVSDFGSADTGELGMAGLSSAPPLPAAGFSEQIVDLRMRMTTHTEDNGGQYLATIRWNDGVGDQEWNVAMNTTVNHNDPDNPIPEHVEEGLQIWNDFSRNVTVQIKSLVSPPLGSVDVRVLAEF